mmetsp:Transcript_3989/g.6998  ORF Transcript_3989/g.6998 Transcript_3989/m.6998 type:complete len:299 (+) Transcript_3989:724-1620(+)
MGGSILAQTDRIMSHDIEHAELAKSTEAHRAKRVACKVKKGCSKGDEASVCCQTIADGSHTMLTNAKANVATIRGSSLEVMRRLECCEVAASQVGTSTNDIYDSISAGVEHLARALTGGKSLVLRLPGGKFVLPSLGKISCDTALELSSLFRKGLTVSLHLVVPVLYKALTTSAEGAHSLLDAIAHVKVVIWGHAVRGADFLDIVPSERCAMNTGGAFLGSTDTDGCLDLDEGGLVSARLGLLNSVDNGRNIISVTVADGQDLPTVRLVPLKDVFRKRYVSVAVNGDLVVIIQHDQFA